MNKLYIKPILAFSAFFLPSFAPVLATNLTATNLTLTNSMAFGLVQVSDGATGNNTAPGFRLTVEQDATNETFTNTIYHPAYTTIEEQVQHEYGYVEIGGHYQDVYGYGIVNSYWVPDVTEDLGYFDENNLWVSVPTVMTPGYWHEEWGNVVVGQEYVSGTQVWQIINSYTTSQEVYHDAYTETEEVVYQSFLRPKIKQAATRTDANWVWQVPEANNNATTMRDIFVLFDGGVRIPSRTEGEAMSLLADNLTYSRAVPGTDFNATQAIKTQAEKLVVTSDQVYTDTARIKDESSLAAHELTLSNSYTSPQNQTTTKLTQVRADGAYFGGMVTVKDNLHVGGVIRVAESGDLSMGIYKNGTQPTSNQP
ncbi:hypothetical protein [Prosthecobacter dejongeii]|uniref:Uncharacterized protein n=1 Tax=Prosthecobacter dejongeii TaxID=48465 RepID=A0A7W7YJS3_9BACT|nr:hypothetical protein [Prosthecobacter dejongeii]MBB5037466.1 hypothetical protein [Prosthecobacter dejongeii]